MQWEGHIDSLLGLALLQGIFLLGVGPIREKYNLAEEVRPRQIATFTAGVVVIFFALTSPTRLFFTLTGLHGAHVTLGVIWLLSIFFYSFKKGGITPKKELEVDLAALYWHFVDVVWIVIFAVVYLFGVFPGFN